MGRIRCPHAATQFLQSFLGTLSRAQRGGTRGCRVVRDGAVRCLDPLHRRAAPRTSWCTGRRMSPSSAATIPASPASRSAGGAPRLVQVRVACSSRTKRPGRSGRHPGRATKSCARCRRNCRNGKPPLAYARAFDLRAQRRCCGGAVRPPAGAPGMCSRARTRRAAGSSSAHRSRDHRARHRRRASAARPPGELAERSLFDDRGLRRARRAWRMRSRAR